MADKSKPLSPSIAQMQDAPTVRPVRPPVVLVVGGPDELAEAARRVAQRESATISVQRCVAANAASAVSGARPFALVLSQAVYGADPDEFAALARDVHAELVVLKLTQVNIGFLEQALRPSLRNALRRFRTETESGPVDRK
jgi:hypothetical protein